MAQYQGPRAWLDLAMKAGRRPFIWSSPSFGRKCNKNLSKSKVPTTPHNVNLALLRIVSLRQFKILVLVFNQLTTLGTVK